MLKKVELDKLEAHWAVSSIPEDVRRTCFDKLRKKQVCDAVGNCIEFTDDLEENFSKTVAKMAMAYEIPAIENISSFTNYADEYCDRELFISNSRVL